MKGKGQRRNRRNKLCEKECCMVDTKRKQLVRNGVLPRHIAMVLSRRDVDRLLNGRTLPRTVTCTCCQILWDRAVEQRKE